LAGRALAFTEHVPRLLRSGRGGHRSTQVFFRECYRLLEAAAPYLGRLAGVGLDSSERGHPPAKYAGVFAEAKRLYVERLAAGKIEKPTAVDEMHRRVMEITGKDPLPYGIAPNRRSLEEVVASALQQKIIAHRITVEELFPPSTHSLVG